MHLRCPHCQNAIEVADLPADGEITCTGCGSSFQLANLATATWDGPTKKRIGKFDVVGTLGHGAFGTVLKAHDTELDRIVAIKVPRAGNVGSKPEDVDRFLREARAVAQLRFPSIISIHEVGADNGTPYLVSDFVDGVTLADLMTGRRPSFQESAKLLAEVADALQYAHSLGIVHRDVKPSNIMIRPDGSPCVMDFGLAKRDAGEITMTIDGQILGTPAYMSPEQARGDAHKVDGRSDVYSLGVILYQLLTGALPFRGNKAMLMHQVLHDDPKSPRSLNDKIPRDLETIALKAMAKEPGRRYVSAKEMADDLRRWLANEPILARPVGIFERTWRWCGRNPSLAVMSGVAVCGCVFAYIVMATSMVVINKAYFDLEESVAVEKSFRKLEAKLAADYKKLAEKEAEAHKKARTKEAEAVAAKIELQDANAELSKANEELNRVVGAKNLRAIGIAMSVYHDSNNRWPAAAIYSKDNKPLLSWRVALLPFLDDVTKPRGVKLDALYREFRLDESWDSEHNLKLLEKMPPVYAPVGVKTKEPHATFYQVFTGKNTLFEGQRALRIVDIPDGASNTIMVVEAAEPAPWTKPSDLPYDEKAPLPKLGPYHRGFNVLLADGSVRFIPRGFDERPLRFAITRNDGQAIDWEKLSRRAE